VVPGVAGSSPVTHPIRIRRSSGLRVRCFTPAAAAHEPRVKQTWSKPGACRRHQSSSPVSPEPGVTPFVPSRVAAVKWHRPWLPSMPPVYAGTGGAARAGSRSFRPVVTARGIAPRTAGSTRRASRPKGAAKAFLQTVGADMQRGQWVDPRGGQMLFRDWVAVWAAARVVRLTTRNADEGRIRNHLLPAFGHLQLKDITPMGVRSFTARLAERRAPATVRHCHALLSPMLASRNGSTACELGVPPRSVQSRGVG
jgi:hypothetical protein